MSIQASHPWGDLDTKKALNGAFFACDPDEFYFELFLEWVTNLMEQYNQN